MNSRKQKEILDIFCNGKIVALEQQGTSINATVQIPLLAKIINEEYEHFIIRFCECSLFKFSGWYSNHFTDDLEMIASISPSMQNCDFQVDDYIKLYCTIQDSFEAELHIKAGDIDIFDHEKKYLSHEKLEQIYDTYWTLINTFSNKIIVL